MGRRAIELLELLVVGTENSALLLALKNESKPSLKTGLSEQSLAALQEQSPARLEQLSGL